MPHKAQPVPPIFQPGVAAQGVVSAAEFIVRALADNPQRVGKRLQAPLDDRHSARRGTYRVIYRIDDEQRSVTVLDIAHRRDAYRANR
jgi:mRNA interferase RelE/StbE